MHEVAIAEVGLDADGRVFVRPVEGEFEYVYRAGMEVYWDRRTRRLSHPLSPRDLTLVQWFQQIVAAVADECGVKLKLNAYTFWVAMPSDLRSDMEEAIL